MNTKDELDKLWSDFCDLAAKCDFPYEGLSMQSALRVAATNYARRVAAEAVAEARAPLVAVLPSLAWFDWAVQSYKKAPDSLTMMMPCTMGDIRKLAAALAEKGETG